MLKSHDVTAFTLMTYSIVALHAEAGEIGAAAATCWPAVGAAVPWLEPGVGAVVTQAFTERSHGPQGLRLLRAGRSAPEVVERLLAGDGGRASRQLGVLDAAGGSAAHTGSQCVAEAGHVCEPGVSVQANMLERPGVWQAMLAAFRDTDGDLAARLLGALRAADDAGGDIRGRRSAALVVAANDPHQPPWARRFDLRVDASEQPLDELAAALDVARAYEAISTAIDAAKKGNSDQAIEETERARALAPDDAQILFWHALVLAANDREADARPVFERAIAEEPRLIEFGRRYMRAGHGANLAESLRRLGRLD